MSPEEEINLLREIVHNQANIIESQGEVEKMLVLLLKPQEPSYTTVTGDNCTTGTTTTRMGVQGKDWDYTVGGNTSQDTDRAEI
ncbi:MAG: hypothetical protein MUP17_05145 [candidate division Zixibacteria bacterium]|nr:hypothetical protein [candidate division Zixibacteria bacterium]